MAEMDYTKLSLTPVTDSTSPEWKPPEEIQAAWDEAYEHQQHADAVDAAYRDEVAVVMDGPGQVEKCPTCERSLPKPRMTDEPRERKSWTIAVPVDERENGAEVLDTLLTECRTLFGHDTNPKVRYYTVAQALALVVQNSTQLAADDAA